ncbi:UNVERIFIED_CONTAM: hypothetical protein FKN15_039283 [Acipenser sinensis]
MCPIAWRSQVRIQAVTADRDREFFGGGAQLAERCLGRKGLGRQGNPRLTAHQRPLWPIGRLWLCSGAARSVLSSGTIGLVALLWICSAKNDGLAGARFGGHVFQPPFSEGNAQRQGSWFRRLRGWLLLGLLLGLLLLSAGLAWIYSSSDDDVTEVWARQSQLLQEKKFFEVPCSEDYENYQRYPDPPCSHLRATASEDNAALGSLQASPQAPGQTTGVAGCTPQKCGRAVTDTVVTREEAERIRSCFSVIYMQASILDLHSGALSRGQRFVNIYRTMRQRIQEAVARTFGLDVSRLYLTKPTFFSRMNGTEAKTPHDEYWHPHIDKVTYGSFDYTSLLYLSDYGSDFGGGRFVFMDGVANRTVEPRSALELQSLQL